MTNTQKLILNVFFDFKTPKNGVLKPQSIDYHSWDRRSQDDYPKALNDLIENGYISTKESWYVLTEKGYEFLYKDYSSKDTEDSIMNVFKKRNLGVGDVIKTNSFTDLQQKMNRFDFDNFNLALQNLINGGFIEVVTDSYFYKLTRAGYDRIY